MISFTFDFDFGVYFRLINITPTSTNKINKKMKKVSKYYNKFESEKNKMSTNNNNNNDDQVYISLLDDVLRDCIIMQNLTNNQVELFRLLVLLNSSAAQPLSHNESRRAPQPPSRNVAGVQPPSRDFITPPPPAYLRNSSPRRVHRLCVRIIQPRVHDINLRHHQFVAIDDREFNR